MGFVFSLPSAQRSVLIVLVQANVMVEYTLAEARELLEKNLEQATSRLKQYEEDLDFLKDQITTTEVSILCLAAACVFCCQILFASFTLHRYCQSVQLRCQAEETEARGCVHMSILISLLLLLLSPVLPWQPLYYLCLRSIVQLLCARYIRRYELPKVWVVCVKEGEHDRRAHIGELAKEGVEVASSLECPQLLAVQRANAYGGGAWHKCAGGDEEGATCWDAVKLKNFFKLGNFFQAHRLAVVFAFYVVSKEEAIANIDLGRVTEAVLDHDVTHHVPLAQAAKKSGNALLQMIALVFCGSKQWHRRS